MKNQRGVALIIALILVALATILASKLTFDGFLERRRAIGVLAAEQALHFGLGAEALAADVLAQDAQNSATYTTLAAPWAQPTQPLPITPQDDPEGEPIGTLQGALEDMQGRFNLNSLGRMIKGPETEHPSAGSAAARAVPAAAELGRARTQVGGDRARLDRCRRYSGESRRRGGSDLHLADAALPHRQLPYDVAQRVDEHAGIRRRSLPLDCPLRDRPARCDRTDQYLHGVRTWYS